jgi:hypothetical protein
MTACLAELFGKAGKDNDTIYLSLHHTRRRRRFGGGRGVQNGVEGQDAIVVQGGTNAGQGMESEDVKSEAKIP